LTTSFMHPNILLRNLKYNKILHKKVALLSILPADLPKASVHERVKVKAKLMDQKRREPMAKGKGFR
jgi:K+ transporter